MLPISRCPPLHARSLLVLLMLALLALAAPTASAERQSTTSTAAVACTPNPEADLSGSLSADGMIGTIRNTSATCAYQVGIAAYRPS